LNGPDFLLCRAEQRRRSANLRLKVPLPTFTAACWLPFIDADHEDAKTLSEDLQRLEAEMEAELKRREVPNDQIAPDGADFTDFWRAKVP
jgi:hypothetical protein